MIQLSDIFSFKGLKKACSGLVSGVLKVPKLTGFRRTKAKKYYKRIRLGKNSNFSGQILTKRSELFSQS